MVIQIYLKTTDLFASRIRPHYAKTNKLILLDVDLKNNAFLF
jgi:hypothetical protein